MRTTTRSRPGNRTRPPLPALDPHPSPPGVGTRGAVTTRPHRHPAASRSRLASIRRPAAAPAACGGQTAAPALLPHLAPAPPAPAHAQVSNYIQFRSALNLVHFVESMNANVSCSPPVCENAYRKCHSRSSPISPVVRIRSMRPSPWICIFSAFGYLLVLIQC